MAASGMSGEDTPSLGRWEGVCKLARRLPVASDRGFELVLAHLGAAFDAQALRLVVKLLLRGFATDHWQMPPFVRGHSKLHRQLSARLLERRLAKVFAPAGERQQDGSSGQAGEP